MKEYNQPPPPENEVPQTGIEVVGNTNIATDLGLISIEVDPVALREELVRATVVYYPQDEGAKTTAESTRLIISFGKQPLKEVLPSRVSEGQRSSLSFWDKLRISAFETFSEDTTNIAQVFENPYDSGELVLSFNIPGTVELLKPKSLVELEEQIVKVTKAWIHERQHLIQLAKPEEFERRYLIERGLVFSSNLVMFFVFGKGVVEFLRSSVGNTKGGRSATNI